MVVPRCLGMVAVRCIGTVAPRLLGTVAPRLLGVVVSRQAGSSAWWRSGVQRFSTGAAVARWLKTLPASVGRVFC